MTSAQLSDGLSSAPSAYCVCPWQPNIVAGVGELMRAAERLSKQEGPANRKITTAIITEWS